MGDPQAPDAWDELYARFRAGDAAARAELFERLHGRLRRLAAGVLKSFPGAGRRHDLDSVVNELFVGLSAAFDRGHLPPDTTEFLRFAAFKLRRQLLSEADWARVRRVLEREGDRPRAGAPDPGTTTLDPAALAGWTEYHRRVERLPDDERAVVELHLYLGLPQKEVAERLGLHPKAVSRVWLSAVAKLAPYVPQKD